MGKLKPKPASAPKPKTNKKKLPDATVVNVHSKPTPPVTPKRSGAVKFGRRAGPKLPPPDEDDQDEDPVDEKEPEEKGEEPPAKPTTPGFNVEATDEATPLLDELLTAEKTGLQSGVELSGRDVVYVLQVGPGHKNLGPNKFDRVAFGNWGDVKQAFKKTVKIPTLKKFKETGGKLISGKKYRVTGLGEGNDATIVPLKFTGRKAKEAAMTAWNSHVTKSHSGKGKPTEAKTAAMPTETPKRHGKMNKPPSDIHMDTPQPDDISDVELEEKDLEQQRLVKDAEEKAAKIEESLTPDQKKAAGVISASVDTFNKRWLSRLDQAIRDKKGISFPTPFTTRSQLAVSVVNMMSDDEAKRLVETPEIDKLARLSPDRQRADRIRKKVLAILGVDMAKFASVQQGARRRAAKAKSKTPTRMASLDS